MPAGWLQGGSEKLGDEDLEAVLDKLVKMLAYISGAMAVGGGGARGGGPWVGKGSGAGRDGGRSCCLPLSLTLSTPRRSPSPTPAPPPPTTDKDLFSEFYRKKLGRRLLHNTSGAHRVCGGGRCVCAQGHILAGAAAHLRWLEAFST